MEEIKLIVEGPFHRENLHFEDRFNEKGFYVWGFVYSLDETGNLDNCIDFSKLERVYDHAKMRFIPFYVGKSQSQPIKDRLLEHYSNIENGSSKYVCFSDGYFKKFFLNASGYPIHKNNQFVLRNYNILLDLIKDKTNPNITFHNHAKILEHIYGPNIRNKNIKKCVHYNKTALAQPEKLDSFCLDCKKNKVDGNSIKNLFLGENSIFNDLKINTLKKFAIDNDSFWFYYCVFEKTASVIDRHEKIENYLYFSLKGKTTSMSEGLCPEPNKLIWKDKEGQNKMAKIIVDIQNDQAKIFNESPSYDFPGYTKK